MGRDRAIVSGFSKAWDATQRQILALLGLDKPYEDEDLKGDYVEEGDGEVVAAPPAPLSPGSGTRISTSVWLVDAGVSYCLSRAWVGENWWTTAYLQGVTLLRYFGKYFQMVKVLSGISFEVFRGYFSKLLANCPHSLSVCKIYSQRCAVMGVLPLRNIPPLQSDC